MNSTKYVSGKLGIWLCSIFCGVLTGCTTYVEQPRVREAYASPPPAYVETSVVSAVVVIHSENDFYQPLSAYGRWEVVGSYGRCWIPSRVDRGWRPYCNGDWERTEAGWYWVSDEPWAWATYHYGRWDYTDEYGWYWMPQTVWAPAWVSWHEGGGYIGWAPLQPFVSISASGFVGFNEARISPRAFVFVQQSRFLQPIRPTTVVVNNTTIINKTVNITNIKIVNNTVINEGPRAQIIEQASGRQVRTVRAQELRHRQEAAVVTRQPTAFPGRKNLENNVQSNEPRGAKETARQLQRNTQDTQRTVQTDSLRQANDAHVKQVKDQEDVRIKAREDSQAKIRNQELEKKSQADALRTAKESEAAAQRQSQQNSRDARRAAQTDSQRQANDARLKGQVDAVSESEAKAGLKAQQHSQALEKKAQAGAQAAARDSENKARIESQRRTKEADQKAREDAQASARDAARAAQQESQPQRGKDSQPNIRGNSSARIQRGPIPVGPSGTNTVEKAQH